MAQPVYSLRIYVAQARTEPAVLYVPDNLMYIVRDIDVYRNSSSSTDYLTVNGSNGQHFAAWNPELLSGGFLGEWRGRQVLYALEPLSFTLSGSWDITVSGYQLTPPFP